MKTNRLTNIATAAVALIASAVTANAANRTLILLQENSNGKSYMTDLLPAGPIRTAADAIIDQFVENGEAAKFQALAAGRYQRFVNLTDANCTRVALLKELIKQSKEGFTIDLAILGHGGTDSLNLHNNAKLTGGIAGNIRSLDDEARAQEGAAFNFKLRLVHMCNCFGGTTNDDWLNIGAKVSVGAPRMDWMPEPMNTFFWDDFVKNDKRVSQAAADSLAATRLIWQSVPGYNTPQTSPPGQIGVTRLAETQQLVSGNGNLIFKDEFQLALNQSRTITVQANRTHTFPLVYLVAGQTYSFTSSLSDTWSNVDLLPLPRSVTVNANGYTPDVFDSGRRFPANMMRLIGERFTHPSASNPLNFVGGSGFSIGTFRTLTAPGHGFLNLYANDIIAGYADNSGSITVTVKRTN